MSALSRPDGPRAVFAMEQHLGHLTYARNLRAAVEADGRLCASWVGIDYDHPDGPGRLATIHPALHGPLAGRRQVVDGLHEAAADVAFFNTQVPAVLGAPSSLRLPYVVATDITPRQYDGMAVHYGHRVDRRRLVAMAKHRVNEQVFRRSRRVVCWSSWCAESVVDDYGVPADRVEVVAPGVDLTTWCPAPDAGPHTDRPLRLLFVGGDLERKGGRLVIDAFRRLPAGRVELHLVTRTPYEPEADGIVVHSDLWPNSPELIGLYQRCDVFVLPSRAEAFGIAAVEASACGLPVVASRSGGLTDIVVDGVTGLALPDVDVESLTAAVERLLADQGTARRMGVAARDRAERLFDGSANGAKVVEILLTAVGRPVAA